MQLTVSCALWNTANTCCRVVSGTVWCHPPSLRHKWWLCSDEWSVAGRRHISLSKMSSCTYMHNQLQKTRHWWHQHALSGLHVVQSKCFVAACSNKSLPSVIEWQPSDLHWRWLPSIWWFCLRCIDGVGKDLGRLEATLRVSYKSFFIWKNAKYTIIEAVRTSEGVPFAAEFPGGWVMLQVATSSPTTFPAVPKLPIERFWYIFHDLKYKWRDPESLPHELSYFRGSVTTFYIRQWCNPQ